MTLSSGTDVNYTVGIIIVSDRAYSGEREDGCIPVFRRLFENQPYTIVEAAIVNDDPDMIKDKLRCFIERGDNLILTSGGTGCAVRDNTPEVTSQLIQKFTPGVDEAIRRFSETKSRNAIYSRALSGIAENSFIINLPGSPKAVEEIITFLLPTLKHPLGLIAGNVRDCATDG